MSIWVKCQNDILKNTDTEILARALKNLDLELDYAVKHVANTWGKSNVDMAIRKNGQLLPIGFKQEGERLTLHGDFFMTGLNEQKFLNQVAQQYTKEDIVEKLSRTSDFAVTDVVTTENGEIELTVSVGF